MFLRRRKEKPNPNPLPPPRPFEWKKAEKLFDKSRHATVSRSSGKVVNPIGFLSTLPGRRRQRSHRKAIKIRKIRKSGGPSPGAQRCKEMSCRDEERKWRENRHQTAGGEVRSSSSWFKLISTFSPSPRVEEINFDFDFNVAVSRAEVSPGKLSISSCRFGGERKHFSLVFPRANWIAPLDFAFPFHRT